MNPEDWQSPFLGLRLKMCRAWGSGLVPHGHSGDYRDHWTPRACPDKLERLSVGQRLRDSGERSILHACIHLLESWSCMCPLCCLFAGSEVKPPQVRILILSALAQSLRQTSPVPHSYPLASACRPCNSTWGLSLRCTWAWPEALGLELSSFLFCNSQSILDDNSYHFLHKYSSHMFMFQIGCHECFL